MGHSSQTAQTVVQVVTVVDTDALGDALDVKAAQETAMVDAKELVTTVVEMAVQVTVWLTAIMVAQTA